MREVTSPKSLRRNRPSKAKGRDATQRIDFAALLVARKRYFEEVGSTRLGCESHRHAFGRPSDTIW